jgi:hypothetical protein
MRVQYEKKYAAGADMDACRSQSTVVGIFRELLNTHKNLFPLGFATSQHLHAPLNYAYCPHTLRGKRADICNYHGRGALKKHTHT